MSLCPACIQETSDGICRHHLSALADDWSEGNRIVCDFIHRGRVPERLPPDLRVEDERFAYA